jgi:serine/threonine protein kinase
MDRIVAIKMVAGGFAENEEQLRRFYREARSTGMLKHRGIVMVHDLGDDEGNPYLVMEYLEGAPLNKLMERGVEFTVTEKFDLIIHVCIALDYAHGRGVVHRDIKPANIMVLRDGSIKIVDFGIAFIADQSLTRTGQVMGTIHYMPPEQINGQAVDGRTDIFAAGVILYRLLTGRFPFDGIDTVSTMRMILDETPPPLGKYLDGVPEELEKTLQRALAKDRDARYASAGEFVADLARLREHIRRIPAMQPIYATPAPVKDQDLHRSEVAVFSNIPARKTTLPAPSYEPNRTERMGLPAAQGIRRAPIKSVTGNHTRGNVFAVLVAIVILVFIAFAGFRIYQGRATAPRATTYVEVNAVPWGTVTSISATDRKFALNLNQQTPLRVLLAPGQYTITLAGPGGEQRVKQIRVSDESPGSYTEVFQVIDVDQILNAH